MLIRFIVENFLSFNESIEFSLVPGRGKIHSHHILKDKRRSGISTLKTAVVYGANASGKSNLIKAVAFSKNLILKGTGPKEQILITPFRLTKNTITLPSRFQFDFKCEEKMFSYGYSADSTKIKEEWLYEISRYKEKLLFKRRTLQKNIVNIEFGALGIKNQNENNFLKHVAQGTRPNQLFLTESVERNVTHFMKIYDWFDNKLNIIFPDTIAHGIEFYLNGKTNVAKAFLKLLKHFDTGISNISTKKYNLEKDKTEIPDPVVNKIKKNLGKKNERIFLSSYKNDRYTILRDKNNELIAYKLITKHRLKNSDEEVSFEINEESDGTQRVLDLIPALLNSIEKNSIIIIDELDRSLHPMLIQEYIKLFLEKCRNQNSQLIVTTHDSTLLNLKLLRKDEIWFIEKNQNGESELFSLEEFKIRYDKNIQKDYLKGRYGAIPYFPDQDLTNILKNDA